MFIFEKFCSCLIGLKVIIYKDYYALKYLLANKEAKLRLLRWILLLQEFNLEIRKEKSTKDLVVDHLSRIEPKDGDAESLVLINVTFLDEYLMSIHTSSWCADIINYLIAKILHLGMTYQQKKHFF